MRKVLVAIGVLGVAIAVVLLLKRGGDESDSAATPSVPQNGSNVQSSPTKIAPSTPAQLVVTVSDAKGPVKGARVRIEPQTGDVTVLETKADGTAQTTLAPGEYEVAASAKDHEPAASPTVKLTAGETKKLAIALPDGGRVLSGTVTDVSGGPIAGARIDAAKLDGMAKPDNAVATTMTGADGKYTLSVAEGQLLVAARSPDYAAQSRYVEVGPTGATADFSLVPGGVIEGVVLDDRSKQPVGGALVSARRDSASIMLAEGGSRIATAGPDGRFRITGLRPGAYELGARAEGRRTRTPTLVGLGVAEQVTDVQLLVGRTPIVRGKVIDESSAPVANARIVTFENFGADEVRSDDKGAFAIEGLSVGKHNLMALVDSHVPTNPTGIEVGDKDLDNVILRMRKAGKLVGHVEPRQPGCEIAVDIDSDRPGLPMEVMLNRGSHTTDANGNFEVAPVTPTKIALTARCASGAQGKAEVAWTPSSGDVAIAVTPGASIAGKLVDGDGKPVAGATVVANPITGTVRTMIVNGMIAGAIQTITTAAGAYELKGLSPGKYRMTALDRGQPMRPKKDPPEVTLANAERKTGVDLVVDRPNGVIKGIVTGADGKPLADAWVSVQPDLDSMVRGAIGAGAGPDSGPPPGPEGAGRTVMVTSDGEGGEGGSFPPALTDAQGRFEIGNLPHLTFDVIAEAQAGKLRGRAERVIPDANITIKVLGVTSLSGTVRTPKGPAGLFTVTLEGPTQTTRSFTDGTFTLARVDPGSYVVKVTSTEGNGEASVTVQPNTPATVDISLVSNAVVVGTVAGPDGKPMADAPVIAVDDTGGGVLKVQFDGPPPTTGPDGKFRVERKAGKAILVVMGGRGPVVRKPITLEEGKTLDVGVLQVEAGKPPEPPKPPVRE